MSKYYISLEERCAKLVQKAIYELYGIDMNVDEVQKLLITNKPKVRAKRGDFSFPCFALAKILGRDATEIAGEIVKKLAEYEDPMFIEFFNDIR